MLRNALCRSLKLDVPNLHTVTLVLDVRKIQEPVLYVAGLSEQRIAQVLAAQRATGLSAPRMVTVTDAAGVAAALPLCSNAKSSAPPRSTPAAGPLPLAAAAMFGGGNGAGATPTVVMMMRG
jgi:hypothetical protein